MSTNCTTGALYGASGRTRTGTSKTGDFKSPAATNYATLALNYLVPPVGIEPTSSVLQTGAMTTFAKAAYFGEKPGIEPCLTVSQTVVRPLH